MACQPLYVHQDRMLRKRTRMSCGVPAKAQNNILDFCPNVGNYFHVISVMNLGVALLVLISSDKRTVSVQYSAILSISHLRFKRLAPTLDSSVAGFKFPLH